ncbi:HD domain-containing protein [Candidatus Uabimicrobium amorphum]|uniref:Phosphohydrolase n=1 Tax=Uabimicrobium amorphum TaxID=2596890 RepID=A0A5S9F4D4_UABAM|nr:HD domain-containing protein [Candidatus Uabimicrobium amorphum]BBM84364.1 phosphohydrolase [Candidatus Uabimicrobium amorphum]
MNWSPDTYQKAWHFATFAHNEQTYGGRKKGVRVPYINHIASVAMEVTWGLQCVPQSDHNLAIQCALLHDTIEDTQVTYKDILQTFGKRVADGVMALSKDETLGTKEQQMLDSLKRIQQQPPEVWMVKMADRITNLYYPPHYWDKDKILRYQKEAKVIYDHLHKSNELLAQRLEKKIEEYNRFLH